MGGWKEFEDGILGLEFGIVFLFFVVFRGIYLGYEYGVFYVEYCNVDDVVVNDDRY